MRITVASPGKLNGVITLPGDHALTLSTLALGMLGGSMVSVVYPASSRDVERVIRFMLDCGGEYRNDVDGFTFRGKRFAGTVTVPVDIPESTFHIVVASAAFSSDRVVIESNNGACDALLAELLPVLRVFGLQDSAVLSGDGLITITGTHAVAPDRITVRSAWEMETIAAVCLASGVSPALSCNRQETSHVLALLEKLGLTIADVRPAGSDRDALARRMAKFTGEKPPEWFRLEGASVDCEIRIPGDTLSAGAVAVLATVLPRSDVTIRGTLWEPGRRGFFETLRRMRGAAEWDPRRGYSFDAADIRVTGCALEGVQTSPAQARTMRSELMLLAVAAAFARGETIVRDASPGRPFGREAFKVLSDGLRSLGAHVGDYEDGVVVKGCFELRHGHLDSGGYPEVAAALAVAGMAASGETTVNGSDSAFRSVEEILRSIGSLRRML